MRRINSFFALIATALCCVALLSCGEQNADNGKVATNDSSNQEVPATPHSDSIMLPEEMILEEIQWHLDHGNFQEAEQWRSMLPHSPEMAPTPKKETTTAQKSKSAQPSGAPTTGQKTLYISTYGANGKVWGHVRMNGNTGRGTIHDDDENTLTITVTRHGNELFGTDQNGRQYVFKL